MNKKTPLIATIVVVVLLLFSAIGSYNGLVSKEESVNEAYAKVESNLQRRYDLIPNVVESTKGYMNHEEKVFTDIANARAKIGSNSQKEQLEGQSELSSAISRLLVLTENYPELKSNEQVNALIVELEGTENRLLVVRNDYNKVVTSYNKSIRSFPGSLYAKLFGFEKKETLQSVEEAKTAPKVSFE